MSVKVSMNSLCSRKRTNAYFQSSKQRSTTHADTNTRKTAVDFIARRCRLAFLNSQTALDVLPRVVDVMAVELGWSSSRKRKELQDGALFLESMGLAAGVEVPSASRTMARVGEVSCAWHEAEARRPHVQSARSSRQARSIH